MLFGHKGKTTIAFQSFVDTFIFLKLITLPYENNCDSIIFHFFNLPVFATIDGYEQTLNRNAPRSFCTMRTKLNDGAIKDMNYLFDNEERLPVFSADISKSI